MDIDLIYLYNNLPRELWDYHILPNISKDAILVNKLWYSMHFPNLLKDDRIHPEHNNNYPIRQSSHIGNVKVLKLLLSDWRVDPCVNNNYPIRTSIKNRREDITKLLLRNNKVYKSIMDNPLLYVLISNKSHDSIIEKIIMEDNIMNCINSYIN
ncbi:Hypothetical protein ORPV_233 [Orpheovirus IHUMI-LCC2]|uniref:Ankyrin-repeat protein n=1 Tax=Orpheovirus IHUMI-LCC2 TaxID=2023057 RepID=A0A2I2L3Q2_9VIRU|nr:Hypothetical protein ORPV_233 [Orpheovirus IHUMI-LCC2]SNW62137.1 Hypothetical protein ORPV_233 [Orpheovirus IHUMI-LCC2]